MEPVDFSQLTADIKDELTVRPSARFGVVGHTPLAYDLLSFFGSIGALARVTGVYGDCPGTGAASLGPVQLKRIDQLASDAPEAVILASDAMKEGLLEEAGPYLQPSTKVLLAGYAHFQFSDARLDAITSSTLVPSLANGYPHTLVHLYQCLLNAARRNLEGIVVEFGMFKGGTTMVLSRVIEMLGKTWKVVGFDTFAGFPARRSAFDMYSHPGCVFHDEDSVRRYLAGRNVEVIAGDILATAERIKNDDIILAFIDTDNYSSATAALDAVQERVVPGGAIVFDHFTGRNRFRYTLGERLAAKRLLADPAYFNLHDTGVFFRQT